MPGCVNFDFKNTIMNAIYIPSFTMYIRHIQTKGFQSEYFIVISKEKYIVWMILCKKYTF